MPKTAIDEKFNTTPKETQMKVSEKIQKKGKKTVEKQNRLLNKLQIKYVPLGKLKPNNYNPNRQSEHDFELLIRSMQEDGFTQPIIAQKDGTIVDGEHRWRAAKALNYREIPVVYVDMSEEQMKISTLRHNRARGEEDIELSVEVLRDLQELGAIEWAQDSLMISDDELNKLLEDIPTPEDLADEEFSEAWEPDVIGSSKYGFGEEAEEIVATVDGRAEQSASKRASIDIRKREKKLKEARSAEEREMIRKESNIYRLALLFSGDEAKLVEEVLKPKPANKLIELCRKEKNTIE